ncbi:hypothetical protein [Streptomyces albicerus]|uniref:hypothetical protein n=1 Tax=Streptomyces albicerus TaxID=2569859 RepID=UPI00124B7802|nr:hypothetical protein [Streptomyces albicerus]
MTVPTPTPHTTPEGRSLGEVLKQRWPTALAIALSVPGMIGGGSEDLADTVGGFGEALPLLPLLYLIVNQTGRPRATWPVLGAGLAVMVALRMQDAVAPSTVFVALALVLLVWGAVRGTPHGPATFGVQAAGAVVFGALALVGLAVDPDLGRYLVAAGWFFHGVWDFVHLKLDKVVARSFAEWCGVVDVLVAVELLFLV